MEIRSRRDAQNRCSIFTLIINDEDEKTLYKDLTFNAMAEQARSDPPTLVSEILLHLQIFAEAQKIRKLLDPELKAEPSPDPVVFTYPPDTNGLLIIGFDHNAALEEKYSHD